MMRKLCDLLPSRRPLAQAGTAAVEFAISLPILIVFMAGLVDYGDAVNLSTRLFGAARVGTQYAVYHPGDISGIVAAATSAVSDPACTAKVTTNCMSVSGPSFAYFCVNVATGAIGTKAQASTAACGAGFILAHFVTIGTSQTYAPSLAYRGLGSTLTLNGSAVIQVQ
jgi:Flp pilus assembly protein TadG